jgi:histidine triad (HIT) family protein
MSEEQVKELQEKLKNMSPEELKEFQKQQCIFCQIISGKVASKKIYEDDKCLAILDINPANPGHILLMPKEHYAIMPLVPEDDLGHLAMVAKALSHVMLNVLKAEGTNIFIANGIAAGQRAQHFMLHVIPRMSGDALPLDIPENKVSAQQLAETKKRIQEKIQAIFKLKKQTVEVKKEVEGKPEIKEAEFIEKPKEVPSEREKFITSATAKRYHKKTCAFAQNIREEKRVYVTKEEAEESGRLPCTCITGKRIPMKKKTAKKKAVSKKTKKKPAKEKPAVKKITKKEGVSLDDIAGLFK